MKLDREEQDQEYAEPECRDAERQRAPEAENAVEPGALRECARECHRYAEQETDDVADAAS